MSGSASARWSEDGDTGSWLVRSEDVLAALGPPPAGWLFRGPSAPAVVLRRAALLRSTPAGPGMDVAWCRQATEGAPGAARDTGEVEVRRLRTLPAGRPMLVRPRSGGVVVVADAGAFERWALQVGDILTVRGQ